MTESSVLSSGLGCIDRLLEGGLRGGQLIHIYGEAASGKSTLAYVFIRAAYRMGGASVLLNCETSSPVERLEQVLERRIRDVQDHLRIFVPKTFEEQAELIDDLDLYLPENTMLVVVDTLTRLYRASLEDKESNYRIHRELNRQMGILKGIATQRGLPVLVLNQVRAALNGDESRFEPVAKSIMAYWADVVIRMEVGNLRGERIVSRTDRKGKRSVCRLVLTQDGLVTAGSSYEKE